MHIEAIPPDESRRPLETPYPAEDGAVPPARISALDELRSVYDAIDDDEEQTKVFDVVGTRTAIRYRRKSREDANRALAIEGTLVERNAQFLLEACDEILLYDQHGKLVPLIPGERVTFDLRPGESIPLHQALGKTETDMRRSVLRVFQGVDDALLEHASAVDRWMGTVRDRTTERFAGGLQVTRP